MPIYIAEITDQYHKIRAVLVNHIFSDECIIDDDDDDNDDDDNNMMMMK